MAKEVKGERVKEEGVKRRLKEKGKEVNDEGSGE